MFILSGNTYAGTISVCSGPSPGRIGVTSNMSNKFQDASKELLKPWYWSSMDLTEQLHKELSDVHILFAKSLKTIARRQDNDDVLFQLENDYYKYAVVHLTWTQEKQTDRRWPATELYKDWDDLYKNRILVDKTGL